MLQLLIHMKKYTFGKIPNRFRQFSPLIHYFSKFQQTVNLPIIRSNFIYLWRRTVEHVRWRSLYSLLTELNRYH